ncbi:Hypothetical predicted protein, partial [Pelobates cultripes]
MKGGADTKAIAPCTDQPKTASATRTPGDREDKLGYTAKLERIFQDFWHKLE